MMNKDQSSPVSAALRRFLVVGGAVLVFIGGFGDVRVSAQTAAGDGHALDANQARQGSRINTPRQRFLLNEINNAIITGNVAGGKGFRGDLGYRADGDFRGATGSNELFSLSAGSYLPGLIYQRYSFLQVPNNRVAQNARYQWSLRPATTVDRAMAGASVSADPFARRQRQQRIISDPAGSLRMVIQPGRVRNSLVGSERLAMLNPQWGLDFATTDFTLSDQTSNSQQSRTDSSRRGSARSYGSADSTGQLDLFGMVRGSGLSQSLRGLPNSDLQRGTPLEQREKQLLFEEGDAGAGSTLLEIGADPYVDLIAEMIGQVNAIPLEAGADSYSDSMIDAIQRYNEQFSQWRGGGEAGGRPDAAGSQLIIPKLEDVRKLESTTLAQLSGNANSQIANLSRAGEKALGEDRFFVAERTFIRILAQAPENQLALAGLAHAQLGAGLFRSAAFSIRTLLTKYPEMAVIKFADNLKPSAVRLKGLITNLRRLRKDNPIADGGLLLAYAGRLAGDALAVREGLDLMGQSSSAADPLREFLRTSWLAPDILTQPGGAPDHDAEIDDAGGVEDPSK